MRHAAGLHRTSYGRLDGSTMWATIPAAFSTEFIGVSCLGYGCWFKSGAYDNNDVQKYMFGFRGPAGAGAIAQAYISSASGVPNISVSGNTSGATSTQTFTSSSFPLPKFQGQWNHLYAENDFERGISRLYLNGILIGELSAAYNNTSIQSGAGATGYIGANSVGGSQFPGWIRDVVLCPRRITPDEVWDLYTKDDIPQEAYHWPCDDSWGDFIECYKGGIAYSPGLASMVGGGSRFSREVPKPMIVTDSDFGYVNLDGVNDGYTFPEEPLLEELWDSPSILLSAWFCPRLYVVSAQGLFYLPDSQPGTALSMSFENGYFVVGATSQDAGFDRYVNADANGWARRIPLNAWHFGVAEMNYTDKIMSVYVNGSLTQRSLAVPWESSTFRCTGGAWPGTLMTSPLYFSGKVGPIMIHRGRRALTPNDIADWYTKHQPPAGFNCVFDVRVKNLAEGMKDYGPRNVTLTTVGSPATPLFGPQVSRFGGPGR